MKSNVIKQKHTSGPWKINENAAGDIYIQAEGGFIATITPAYGDVPDSLQKTRHANAQLIAAAPELLEVARDLVRGMEDGEQPGEVFFSRLLDQARWAIAKAQGELTA